MTRTSKPLEKDIERAILLYLELLPECFAWKNDNVGIYDPRKKTYRKVVSKFKPAGVADIIGIYMGKFLAIEVKRPGGKTTEHQKAFLEQIKISGGIAFVAHSVDEVIEKLEEVYLE